MTASKSLLRAGWIAFWGVQLIGAARPQCHTWNPAFDAPGLGNQVLALTVFDDGTGPALYAGGWFDTLGVPAPDPVLKWDGTSWSTLASGWGTLSGVRALAVFDDGGGPALYAGGDFQTAGGVAASNLARWDGTTWSSLGSGTDGRVNALAVFDDGTGPALFAGGLFTQAGGVTTASIAKWDGANWSALGTGMDGEVTSLADYDDGTGSALYAGGVFAHAGGVAVGHLARWRNGVWSHTGAGFGGGSGGGSVEVLAVFDDGGGPALYAGGYFQVPSAPADCIARFDGTSWSALGSGVNSEVDAIAVHDDGGGPALWIGGHFTEAGNAPAARIAKWSGASWHDVGGANADVRALQSFDDGHGQALFAGGDFLSAGGVLAAHVAKRTGAGWSALGPPGQGVDGLIYTSTVFDDGGGPALYAAGSFQVAGGVAANNIARWNGSSWSAVGAGSQGTVSALAVWNDGHGPALYVGGWFTSAGGFPAHHIAKWDGTTFSDVGGGLDGAVLALAVFDDGTGPALYAGGQFQQAGGIPANNVAKWDGVAWSSLRGGVTGAPPNGLSVSALAALNGPSGRALYAGGQFTRAGSQTANRIARWDGTSWYPLGSGVSGSQPNRVLALTAFDDGTGPGLYVGGQFTSPGNFIARWNGSGWSQLSGGTDWKVLALCVFDDGTGPALYAGGEFSGFRNGSVFTTSRGIARWSLGTWSSIGGVDQRLAYAPQIPALTAFDDGSGGGLGLYVGGFFRSIAGVPSVNVANWRGCAGPGVPLCFGVSGHCPCGNTGMSGAGCMNSIAQSARLVATGTTHPDTIVLTATGELPTALTIFLQGTTMQGAAMFGDGLMCVGGNLERLYVKSASGGSASAPGAGDPSITVRSAALGDPIAGVPHYYMTYYRDPDPAFCPSPPGSTFNASNALMIVW